MGRMEDEAGIVDRLERPQDFVADSPGVEGGQGRSSYATSFAARVAFYAGAILALTLLGAVILFFATGARK